MELQDLFIATGVALVAIIAIMSWVGGLNNAYGTNIGESGFNTTLSTVRTLAETDLRGVSIAVANNTEPTSGAGETDQQEGLLKRSWSTIKQLNVFAGLIPSMIGDAADIMDIPQAYYQIGKWIFLVVFGLTIAYVLLLGVQKLL